MNKTKDNRPNLLEGNIRQQLIALALPLLLGNVLQQLYNTVDSLIIGRFLGTEAFAAAGIAGTVMNLGIFILNGFCVGISVIFAQAYGRRDYSAFRKEVFVSFSLGSLFAIAFSGIFLLFLSPILRLLNSPEALIPYAESYLRIIIGGMIAAYLYNLLAGLLRAVGNTAAATLFLFISVLLNTVGDYLFVAVFHWGIAGAAFATVLAQAASALMCLFYLSRKYPDLLCKREDIGLHPKLVKQSISFGCSTALQQSSLYIGKLLVQGSVNLLGSPGIAGYTATMRLEGFANSFGDSGGHAMSVFISQNVGGNKPERVKAGLKCGMTLYILLSLLLSAIMFFTAVPGVSLFMPAEETLALQHGVSYMRIVACFYLFNFIGSIFVGYYRGIGKIHITVLGTTMHISLRALLSFLWIRKMGLGAVALASGLGWVLIVSFQIFIYLRYRKKGIPSFQPE